MPSPLLTAGDLAISGPSALHDYPAIALGAVPANLTCAAATLPLDALEKQDAPHYLPLPTPVLGHYLKLEGHPRAYLAAGGGLSRLRTFCWPKLTIVRRNSMNALLQTLAVVPGVSALSAGYAAGEVSAGSAEQLAVGAFFLGSAAGSLMPQHASAVYALLTALNLGAIAEGSQSRSPPRVSRR